MTLDRFAYDRDEVKGNRIIYILSSCRGIPTFNVSFFDALVNKHMSEKACKETVSYIEG
jgi:hypothetical protein